MEGVEALSPFATIPTKVYQTRRSLQNYHNRLCIHIINILHKRSALQQFVFESGTYSFGIELKPTSAFEMN